MASHLWSSVTIRMIFGGVWTSFFWPHDQKSSIKKRSFIVLLITGRKHYLSSIVLVNDRGELPSGRSYIPTIFARWDFHSVTGSPFRWFLEMRKDSPFLDHEKYDKSLLLRQ